MREKSSFSALLKRFRQAAGLSQEALAARAGLSARAISDLERGINRTPRYDTLELLSNALSLTVQQRQFLQASARPEVYASLDLPIRDFPLPPGQLVGREQERASALALLRGASTRLLTLTGPSGVGKTRLALQLMHDLSSDFAGGMVFVALAPIRDATLVPGIVAQALGLYEQDGLSQAEQVRLFLHDKNFVLVLDNVEQILECAVFIADLLASCPRLRMLVTSRTPLRARAEQEFQLAPLHLEDAMTLFRERAQSIRPSRKYAMSEVASICQRLDRLPLAIELAAMHVKVLSLPELLARLTHRLVLLSDGPRDLPERQQTMEDAIAWSYELLTEEQQRCFRAFGVFVGGWTLEAAAAVCWEEGEIEEATAVFMLAALIDASLIHAEVPVDGSARFGMLELMREYALGRLRAAGEEEQCRRRHASYYARLAETIVTYFGPEQAVRDEHFDLDREFPNARAALQWAEERQEAELGLRLSGFSRLWHVRGQMSEAERWMERMLALDSQAREQGKLAAPLSLRIEKLYGLARTLVRHGRADERALAIAEEALRLAQSIDDHNAMSSVYATLGMIAQAQGRLDEAAAAFMESYWYARLTDQRGLQSRALVHLAEVTQEQGDRDRAAQLLEESLSLTQSIGLTWDIPIILTRLAALAFQQQNHAVARARYREALTLFYSFSSLTYIASCLAGLAATLAAEGRYGQAIRLCAAATYLREQTQTMLSHVERDTFEQLVASTKVAVDEAVFLREWERGTMLSLDEVIDDAVSEASGDIENSGRR